MNAPNNGTRFATIYRIKDRNGVIVELPIPVRVSFDGVSTTPFIGIIQALCDEIERLRKEDSDAR